MTTDTKGFSGETETVANPEFDKAVQEIKEALSKENPSFLDTCKLMANADETYTGMQKELAAHLGMNKTELNKRIAIGNTSLFYDKAVRPTLPAGSALLYELSRVKNLDDAVRSNALHPELTREEIAVLRQIYGGSKRYMPWTDSPPTQAEVTETAASIPAKATPRKWTLPKGIVAMVEMPKTAAAQRAILKALSDMREAGVGVHDHYTIEDERMAKAFVVEEAEVVRRINREVRRAISKARKAHRKSKSKISFESMYGSPDELQLDDTLERARQVYGEVADSEEFDVLLEDIRRAVPSRSFRSLVPFFESELDPEEEKAIKEKLKLLQKDPKVRDFSKLQFD